MSQGMTEGQKARTRLYLDEFKENNGGCILCGRKVSDYYFTPAETDGHPELRMYGSCAGHSMLSNSDELLEEAVQQLLLQSHTVNSADEIQGKPVLEVVVFQKDGEDLKYACEPTKKKK